MMTLSGIARGIGQGLLAGLAGTAAMTVSSTLEARIRGRAASTAPARAAQKALGIERFASGGAERRFSTLVHWGYGTSWGALRGLLREAGASPVLATTGHFTAVWGSAQATLPVLDVAPPITMWGAKEIAIDAWHHAVYILATASVYELLQRSGNGSCNGSARRGTRRP